MTPARLALDIVLGLILLGICGLFILVLWMPGSSFHGNQPSYSAAELETEGELRRHIGVLAGDIGRRHTKENLQRTYKYIESVLSKSGYKSLEQEYVVENTPCKNIEAELKGATSELVIVCAHYDSVVGTVGADDNASGVASTLEIARLLKEKSSKKTIRFLLFGTEEPPYFSSRDMGSYHYAMRCKERGERIAALLDLETLAYYTEAPNSQHYPSNFMPPGYPTTGNFIAFVGNLKSRSLVEDCVRIFRETTTFPSEGIAAPEWVNGVDWADQYWFWKLGYPGVMITDTAPYRYPYYHDVKDTPEKLSYPAFARVVTGLSKVVDRLAN
ncbi:MAG: M28 family peptidase [Candidatus Obscuribacterales bacterium]|nr:M28 family peptidase [Candidatus Obscuribacterales bacterium]